MRADLLIAMICLAVLPHVLAWVDPAVSRSQTSRQPSRGRSRVMWHPAPISPESVGSSAGKKLVEAAVDASQNLGSIISSSTPVIMGSLTDKAAQLSASLEALTGQTATAALQALDSAETIGASAAANALPTSVLPEVPEWALPLTGFVAGVAVVRAQAAKATREQGSRMDGQARV